MSLILRNTKGSPLTYTEMDGNFTHLSSTLSGSITVTGSIISDTTFTGDVSASAFSGSFFGDGSGLTGVGGGGNFANADLTLTGNRTHDLDGNTLTLDNGQTTIQGAGLTSATTALLVENSGGTDLFKIDNSGGFALGYGATYTNFKNVSIGSGATATGSDSSIAIGRNSQASNHSSIAIGNGSIADGSLYGIAIGGQAYAQSLGSICLGINTDASTYAMALGYAAQATNDTSLAIGRNASSSGLYSTSIGGRQTSVTASYSILLSASSTAKTLATAGVFAVNLNNANNVLQIGQSTDSYYSGTGNFGFGTQSPSASVHVNGDLIYKDPVTSEDNSGGAISVTMTESTYPSNTIISVDPSTASNTVSYTLPAVTSGLRYTFVGKANANATGVTVTFSGPSAVVGGVISCSDGNKIISGAGAGSITNIVFSAGNFKEHTRIDFICDGTNWVVSGHSLTGTASISTS